MRGRGAAPRRGSRRKKRRPPLSGVVEYPGAALVEIMLTCRQLASRQRRIGRVRACVAKARDARALGRSFGSVAFRAPRSPRASFAAACRGPPRPFRRSPSRPTPPRNRIRPDRDGRLRPRLPLLRARLPRALGAPSRRAPLARDVRPDARRRPLRVCRFLPRRGDRPRGARRGRDGAPMRADFPSPTSRAATHPS